MLVLVTGAAGFVGFAVVEALLARGDDVVALDSSPVPRANLESVSKLTGRLSCITAEIRADDIIEKTLQEYRVEAVVHGAAVTASAARARRNPAAIVNVNVGGVAHVLQASARCGVERVVYLGSNAVYGRHRRTEPQREDSTPVEPESFYGSTKACGEAIALGLGELLQMEVIAARLGTCFGPWERDTGQRDTLSPQWQIMDQAEHGQEVVLDRSGWRDWLYVRDAAAAVLALLDAPALAHRVYNIGSGFVWTLADWCRCLGERIPQFRWRMAEGTEQPTVDQYASYDPKPVVIERVVADTSYRPRFDMAASLEDYLRWRRCHAN